MRSVARACVVAAALWSVDPVAANDFDLRYHDERLTVRIDRVPLDDVLAALSRETGIAIYGEPLDRRDVSKRFDAVPLGQALKRLVGRQNFVLQYGADGTPRRLELLGAPLAPPTKRPPAQQRGVHAVRLLLAHQPVDLPPRSARALGGARLPLQRVLAGLRNDDPFVRDECAQTVVRSIEANKRMLDAVEQLDARQLVDFVRGQARGHAADAAARLYRAARDPRLKGKLSLVTAAIRRMIG